MVRFLGFDAKWQNLLLCFDTEVCSNRASLPLFLITCLKKTGHILRYCNVSWKTGAGMDVHKNSQLILETLSLAYGAC